VKKYEDVVLDSRGNAVAGATVTVKDYPSGTSSTAYAANAIGANVNPLTTDADGRFSCFLKDGSYSFQVTKSGITTETQTNVSVKEPMAEVNVDGYGAVGDDSTDDAAAIQAAEDALTTAGGVLVFTPGKTYKFNSQLTKKSNVNWRGLGATLHWGGGATVAITNGTSGILERVKIEGLKFDIGTASKGLEVNSIYDVHLRRLRFASNSSTNFAIDVGVNTAGGTNAEANRNSAHSSIKNVLVTGDVGTVWRLNGGSSASEVCTLIDIGNIIATSVKVRGGDVAKWADNFTLSGIHRYACSANNSGGLEIGTSSPSSDVGIYGITINHLATDCFGSLSGRYGLKLNFCDGVKGKLYNDPAGEAGQLVASADARYEITYDIAGTNDTITVMDAATARFKARGAKVPYILAKSGAAVTAPLDTSKNALATVSVPANAMGANGQLRITALFNCATATTNRTLTIDYGGTTFHSKVLSNEVNMELHTLICNMNSASAQQSLPKFYSVNGVQLQTPVTGAIDTTSAQNLVLSVTKATGADPCILKHYLIELLSDGA